MKIRSPDYYNLQGLNIISSCHYLADLIAVLGSADFVLGSVDRIPPKISAVEKLSIRIKYIFSDGVIFGSWPYIGSGRIYFWTTTNEMGASMVVLFLTTFITLAVMLEIIT